MTTPNPWERLREAAEGVVGGYIREHYKKVAGHFEFTVLARDARTLIAALAALPATPPQQPVPDAKVADLLAENARLRAEIGAMESRVPDEEREQAIEAWRAKAESANLDLQDSDGSCFPDPLLDEAVALMRSAPQKPAAEEPKPASPASDWRERFDAADGTDYQFMRYRTQALRDGLAAVEDRLAKIERGDA